MIEIAPFASAEEHQAYCDAAGVAFDPEGAGFKLFDEDGEKMGLIQVKFVNTAAYLLNISAVNGQISSQVLANYLAVVLQFLKQAGFASVVYPIQGMEDEEIASFCGMDRVSDTLFLLDFPQEESEV